MLGLGLGDICGLERRGFTLAISSRHRCSVSRRKTKGSPTGQSGNLTTKQAWVDRVGVDRVGEWWIKRVCGVRVSRRKTKGSPTGQSGNLTTEQAWVDKVGVDRVGEWWIKRVCEW